MHINPLPHPIDTVLAICQQLFHPFHIPRTSRVTFIAACIAFVLSSSACLRSVSTPASTFVSNSAPPPPSLPASNKTVHFFNILSLCSLRSLQLSQASFSNPVPAQSLA